MKKQTTMVCGLRQTKKRTDEMCDDNETLDYYATKLL